MMNKISSLAFALLFGLALALAGCSSGSTSSNYSSSNYNSTDANSSSNSNNSNSTYRSSTSSNSGTSRNSGFDDGTINLSSNSSNSSTVADDDDEEMSDAERQEAANRIIADARAQHQASAQAACQAALNRMNALASQGGAAALGSSDQYYTWMSALRQAQADANLKCQSVNQGSSSQGGSSYGSSSSGGGSLSGYGARVQADTERQKAQDRARDDYNNRRLNAIRNGADPSDLPKNPYP